jgi:hypothetical protein
MLRVPRYPVAFIAIGAPDLWVRLRCSQHYAPLYVLQSITASFIRTTLHYLFTADRTTKYSIRVRMQIPVFTFGHRRAFVIFPAHTMVTSKSIVRGKIDQKASIFEITTGRQPHCIRSVLIPALACVDFPVSRTPQFSTYNTLPVTIVSTVVTLSHEAR